MGAVLCGSEGMGDGGCICSSVGFGLFRLDRRIGWAALGTVVGFSVVFVFFPLELVDADGSCGVPEDWGSGRFPVVPSDPDPFLCFFDRLDFVSSDVSASRGCTASSLPVLLDLCRFEVFGFFVFLEGGRLLEDDSGPLVSEA